VDVDKDKVQRRYGDHPSLAPRLHNTLLINFDLSVTCVRWTLLTFKRSSLQHHPPADAELRLLLPRGLLEDGQQTGGAPRPEEAKSAQLSPQRGSICVHGLPPAGDTRPESPKHGSANQGPATIFFDEVPFSGRASRSLGPRAASDGAANEFSLLWESISAALKACLLDD